MASTRHACCTSTCSSVWPTRSGDVDEPGIRRRCSEPPSRPPPAVDARPSRWRRLPAFKPGGLQRHAARARRGPRRAAELLGRRSMTTTSPVTEAGAGATPCWWTKDPQVDYVGDVDAETSVVRRRRRSWRGSARGPPSSPPTRPSSLSSRTPTTPPLERQVGAARAGISTLARVGPHAASRSRSPSKPMPVPGSRSLSRSRSARQEADVMLRDLTARDYLRRQPSPSPSPSPHCQHSLRRCLQTRARRDPTA